jgi:hypothetical protein
MNVIAEPSTPTAAVWHLLTDRWRGTLRAKALSPLTERDYLSTARRWADWLAAEGLDLEPEEVRDRHIDDFIAGIVMATSAAAITRTSLTYSDRLPTCRIRPPISR